MIIALLGLIIMAFILFSTGGDTQTMKYSEVIDYFEQGKVSEFVLNMKNGAMQLTLTEEATQELLEQQPGMTLGGQQTGALGGLWGFVIGRRFGHGKTGCAHLYAAVCGRTAGQG